ncbi:MAG: glycosyltransferase, partial [bacterium]
MLEEIDLSIVIVTWNSCDEINDCLESIIKNINDLKYEIIVVDNNSSDGTLEKLRIFREKNSDILKIIINKENSGYTKACNTGINSSSGRNILLLNPDTKIIGSALKDLLTKLNSNS